MLKFYRKNVKLFIWLIVLSFVIWGAGSISMSTNTISPYIGTVGKEKISQKEFLITTRYFELLNQSKVNQEQKNETTKPQETATDQKTKKEETKEVQNEKANTENEPPAQESLSYDQVKGLAWQMIVLSREAKQEGVVATDEEVQNEIRRLFSQGNVFQQDFYEQWVQNNFRVQVREFEELIRKHLMSDKLREKILKDVPEEKRNTRWLEWFIPVISKSELKEWGQPATVETPTPKT
jgi:hypothetical protein